jgi:hypothetical protein
MSMLRLFAAAIAAATLGMAADRLPSVGQLVAHEWGTFTSVADGNGSPLSWIALNGPAALPCFVHLPAPPVGTKSNVFATVRMETPVIYFYTPRKVTLDVGVTFQGGRFTEWYPQVTAYQPGRIEWTGIEALPGEDVQFPRGNQPNHYYEARATDSAPLRIGDEQEKLVFYRGLADLDVPVRPRFLSDGRLELRQSGSAPVPSVIVFENRDGRMGFRTVGMLEGKVEVNVPELKSDSTRIRGQLADALVTRGLYPKEAAAMLATWKDSWFEPGMRVFYIAPRTMIDAVLPLTIHPVPSATERVFVGRVEVLTPALQREIVDAVAKGDHVTLGKYSRFLYAWWQDLRQRGLIAKSVDLWGLAGYKEERCAQ